MRSIGKRPVRRVAHAAMAVAAVFAGATIVASTASAATVPPGYTLEPDNVQNDVPGQKDLTGHGAKIGSISGVSALQVLWYWDDTTVSGKNTLDACVLMDTDLSGAGVGFSDAALCATVANKGGLSLTNTSLYSCTDAKKNTCTGAVLVNTTTVPDTRCRDYAIETGVFDASDFRMFCDIVLTSYTGGLNLSGASLLNTCSYPSSSPTSDYSDCVRPEAMSTPALSGGARSLYPTATMTLSGWDTTGTGTPTLTIKLWKDSCGGTLVGDYTSTFNITNTSTSQTFTTTTSTALAASGTYYWSVETTGNTKNVAIGQSCDYISSFSVTI